MQSLSSAVGAAPERAVDPSPQRLHSLPTGTPEGARQSRHAGSQRGPQRLVSAFNAFETFPALRKSRDEMLAAARGTDRSELIAVVESDPALTIGVLRAAAGAGARPVDVPTALAALSSEQIETAASELAVFDFFEQSRTWSGTAEQFRLHARATQNATDYVRRALGLPPRPELLVAALLHDIGKLVMLRAYDRYEPLFADRGSPGDRIQLERTELGLDHALAGGVLARRLGLADSLAGAIEHHHSEQAVGDAAIIGLADMLAHYVAGNDVDPTALTAAARRAGLSGEQLRTALDELAGGAPTAPRSAVPSPLSPRETEMVQKLAAGKMYKEIAGDFGLQVSTVRTHLYNTYRKLDVADRAQAVLLATSRGWL
jgi:DNA-binding CsgD family transcriptional regulator/HD-like signal output (HDOD) protein